MNWVFLIIVFKYKKNKAGVFQVSKKSYRKCRKSSPIQKMSNGNSVFRMTEAGRFYFISSKRSKCKKGQKLQIDVENSSGFSLFANSFFVGAMVSFMYIVVVFF